MIGSFILLDIPSWATSVFWLRNSASSPRVRIGLWRSRALIAFGLVAVLMAGCERTRLDEQAEVLCAKDGGIKVYETVTLSADKFNDFGQPKIPRDNDEVGFGYYSTYRTVHLAGSRSIGLGEGAGLWRHDHQIIRSSDKKVMGASIAYSRIGGELLEGIFLSQGYVCPSIQPWALERTVFLKEQLK